MFPPERVKIQTAQQQTDKNINENHSNMVPSHVDIEEFWEREKIIQAEFNERKMSNKHKKETNIYYYKYLVYSSKKILYKKFSVPHEVLGVTHVKWNPTTEFAKHLQGFPEEYYKEEMKDTFFLILNHKQRKSEIFAELEQYSEDEKGDFKIFRIFPNENKVEIQVKNPNDAKKRRSSTSPVSEDGAREGKISPINDNKSKKRAKRKHQHDAGTGAVDEKDKLILIAQQKEEEIERLKEENAQQKEENAQLKEENAQQKKENAQLKEENAQLKAEKEFLTSVDSASPLLLASPTTTRNSRANSTDDQSLSLELWYYHDSSEVYV